MSCVIFFYYYYYRRFWTFTQIKYIPCITSLNTKMVTKPENSLVYLEFTFDKRKISCLFKEITCK